MDSSTIVDDALEGNVMCFVCAEVEYRYRLSSVLTRKETKCITIYEGSASFCVGNVFGYADRGLHKDQLGRCYEF